jgi:hypothetical protein
MASLRTLVVKERCSIEIAWQNPMLNFAKTGGILRRFPSQEEGSFFVSYA